MTDTIMLKMMSLTMLGGADFVGTQTPGNKAGETDGRSGTGYLLLGTDNEYKVRCCGTITDWTIVASATGTIYFQVWRPSGTSYTLVGENEETVVTAGGGPQTFAIAVGNQISVGVGDRVGWYVSGTNMVEHKTEGGSPDNTILTMAKPTVGQTLTWSGATTNSSVTYAFKAKVDANGGTDPTIDSPADGTIHTITNDVSIGYFIDTVTWSDPDVGDTLTISMSTNTKFNFDTGTGNVTVASSLAGPDSTELLVFTVTDFCSNVASSTAPVIHAMPVSDSLLEDATLVTLLYTINATDSVDTVSCSFNGVVTDPFTVKLIPGTSNYGIYSNANPNFDYDTKNQYDLTVVCSDGYKDSNTGTFYLYLVKNQPPVIHNLQGATTLSTSSGIGTNVFNVNTTDFEGDTLTYTMTCDPPACPFEIFASGQIQLNADISSFTTVGYDIEITVADAKNTVGPKTLTVLIKDINDPVLLTNLPLTSSYVVPENSALSSSVFTVSFSDQDTQTWTFSMSSTPGTGLSYFSLDSSGLISTAGTALDYETLAAAGTTSFTFVISVSDGTASDTEPLVIDIINVNEAPQFPQSSYSLSTTEGAAGHIIGTPSFGVIDQDTGDSHTLSIDCGTDTGYFLMNPSTGEVSYQSNYDTGAGLPSTVTCNVMVEDSGGLTDTATLNIYISDSNDNTPVFFPASYSFFISYYSSVGTDVGTVTATDGDTGTFGTLSYTLDQASLLDEYFAVDTNGQITVLKSPSPLGYSTTVTINATATDGGGLSAIASVTIGISDTTTTSTTTTTDRYKTFIEDGRNVAWLVPCCIVLVVIVGVLVWVISTCNGDKGCTAFKRQLCKKKKKKWRPRPRRQMTPPTPPTPPIRNLRLNSYRVSVRKPPPPKAQQAWRSAAV
ncbi:protocadherin Fat 4-like [Mercenaria mercenaria]|uniref:protocadherin Fat 4-like n=1 Tax=Mercenaria mercenaria TaxID=6596 RepID=UPI00234F9E5D|nr:protocadherin Fat 4-like [Mercenaria mercenaria]